MTMAALCRNVPRNIFGLKVVPEHPAYSLMWIGGIRHKFTKTRYHDEFFQPKPEDHEKYGGDPEQPHQLHLVTRIKSGLGRPYWEKNILKVLGLEKAHRPVVHKNIPAVNEKLKIVKHLVRIQPLKLPHGIPTEEDIAETYLRSTGELVIHKKLKPIETKSIEP
ncbi:39S ribosomal protein L30, mitochondrial [Spea bombifrons]|uniref:39S ribosomal protein L30, mitochondrial n=1 Tax=Spea bombifrons TaxID=233779 RepID=UPI002349E054|nr:39S ribosomal protein L30, mitochondrial [Spea bombifrons]